MGTEGTQYKLKTYKEDVNRENYEHTKTEKKKNER